MVKLVSTLAGLVGVFWLAIAGGYAVWWYDRRPAGVPAPIILHVLWLHPSFGLPPSLRAERDAARVAYQTAIDRSAARIAAAQQAYAALSARAAAADARAEQTIRTRTIVLTQEIPRVLTPDVDRRFPVPFGLVRVHDAAVAGLELPAVSGAAGQPDDVASPVTAARLGEVIAGNYGACRADQARLQALQAWARDMAAVRP